MTKANELIVAVIAFHNFLPAYLDGIEYEMNQKDGFFNFNKALKEFPLKHKLEKITVDLNNHQDYLGNSDLGFDHIGFTVGKGKIMYRDMIWRSSGTCTVYPIDDNHWPRNLTGNKHVISIYFKQK